MTPLTLSPTSNNLISPNVSKQPLPTTPLFSGFNNTIKDSIQFSSTTESEESVTEEQVTEEVTAEQTTTDPFEGTDEGEYCVPTIADQPASERMGRFLPDYHSTNDDEIVLVNLQANLAKGDLTADDIVPGGLHQEVIIPSIEELGLVTQDDVNTYKHTLYVVAEGGKVEDHPGICEGESLRDQGQQNETPVVLLDGETVIKMDDLGADHIGGSGVYTSNLVAVKPGSTHQFGIQHSQEGNGPGSVYTGAALKLVVETEATPIPTTTTTEPPPPPTTTPPTTAPPTTIPPTTEPPTTTTTQPAPEICDASVTGDPFFEDITGLVRNFGNVGEVYLLGQNGTFTLEGMVGATDVSTNNMISFTLRTPEGETITVNTGQDIKVANNNLQSTVSLDQQQTLGNGTTITAIENPNAQQTSGFENASKIERLIQVNLTDGSELTFADFGNYLDAYADPIDCGLTAGIWAGDSAADSLIANIGTPLVIEREEASSPTTINTSDAEQSDNNAAVLLDEESTIEATEAVVAQQEPLAMAEHDSMLPEASMLGGAVLILGSVIALARQKNWFRLKNL